MLSEGIRSNKLIWTEERVMRGGRGLAGFLRQMTSQEKRDTNHLSSYRGSLLPSQRGQTTTSGIYGVQKIILLDALAVNRQE